MYTFSNLLQNSIKIRLRQIYQCADKLDRFLPRMQASYIKYKAFVVSIEKAIASNPAIQIIGDPQGKAITTQEFAIKITLKADLLREGIPEQFRPTKDKGTISTATVFNAQNPVVEAPKEKQSITHDMAKDLLHNQPLQLLHTSLHILRKQKK